MTRADERDNHLADSSKKVVSALAGQNVDVVVLPELSAIDYSREAFATWHPFAISRAIENQIYFLSLNRAGKNWGNSLHCLPWMDENTHPINLPEHDERFEVVTLRKSEIRSVRENYTFLKDRLESYDLAML